LNPRPATAGDSSVAFVTAAATSHGDTVSSRGHLAAVAAAAAATATTASASPDPAGSSGTGSPLTAAAARVNSSLSRPAFPAARRSQPRTVPSGTPSAAATGRCPRPLAAAASAAPITGPSSALRSSSRAGSRTCVAPHALHRDRRGRTTVPRLPGPNTVRRLAQPHRASRPPHRGQASPPSPSIRSTDAASLPTVSTGAPSHPHAALPGVTSPKVTGRAAPVTDTLTVSPRTTPRNKNPRKNRTLSLSDANPPLHAHAERRRTVGQWWALRGGPVRLDGPESLLLRCITAVDLTGLAEKLCLQERLDRLDPQELAAVYEDKTLPRDRG
jgi:hypothetical protein